MPRRLLDGLRVLDAAGELAAMTARILADLGAEVVRVEEPSGDPLRSEPLRHAAWNAGKSSLALEPRDPRLAALLAGADVVIDTPGWPGTPRLDPSMSPAAVWVRVTPFGLAGPLSAWRATDLGVMAASGNMYATGDADRPPVRCSEPSGYAHVGAEAAVAALTGVASGRPQVVDVSAQEAIMVASMCAPATFAKTGFRGARRGANIGRTREIWRCKDGYVSFGLRGGKARVPSLEAITSLVVGDGIPAASLTGRDWSAYNHTTIDEAEVEAIEAPIAEYFSRHAMSELYEIACETNLMLAPANTPPQIDQSAQLDARGMFGGLGPYERFPLRFVVARSADGGVEPATARSPASSRPGEAGSLPAWPPRSRPASDAERGAPAWEGTRIVELGSGAAGPIATRYFAEHGATVVRIESRTRPDFLRTYALGPGNPHGLEGSRMFDGLNVGKLSVALNLKKPGGVQVARRLVHWADAVAENFAPRAMAGFGLDYDTLAAEKPDLVMVSACLNGQTGPHKDYPGFGGQGSALSGYNALTGWPDREPVGPFGTITDSLAPRFVATALAAGLLYRRGTGKGAYLDVSQVEAAVYTLSPWLLDWTVNGRLSERAGNRSGRAAPHGAFRCRGDDRWVAVAVWDDASWERLAQVLGLGDDLALAGREERLGRAAELEDALATWTADRDAGEVAAQLQGIGVESVPVADFGDVLSDPQLRARGHFEVLEHPCMGPGPYERSGFRLSNSPSGYWRTGPTIGQDNERVLVDLLGLTGAEVEALEAEGAVE